MKINAYRLSVYRCAKCRTPKHDMRAALYCCGVGVVRRTDDLVPLASVVLWWN